jgi:hypothetical protein
MNFIPEYDSNNPNLDIQVLNLLYNSILQEISVDTQ